MAHCPYAELADLSDLLNQIRSLPGIREPKPGIFYWRGKGFLHFHRRATRRWADIRAGADWGEPVELPLNCDNATQAAFWAEVQQRWQTTTGQPI